MADGTELAAHERSGEDPPEHVGEPRERDGDQPNYIILLTAMDRKENIVAGLAAGADDYVVKPVDRIELLLKVRELLKFSHLKQLARHGS